jgi:hypothetical protein
VQDAHVRCVCVCVCVCVYVCIQLPAEHALMPTRGEVELHQPAVRPISCHVTPSIPPLTQWQTKDILEDLRIQQPWLLLACVFLHYESSIIAVVGSTRAAQSAGVHLSLPQGYHQHLLPHCHSYKQMHALRSILAPSEVHEESNCWLLRFCLLHIWSDPLVC